jgi:hypothetical protein
MTSADVVEGKALGKSQVEKTNDINLFALRNSNNQPAERERGVDVNKAVVAESGTRLLNLRGINYSYDTAYMTASPHSKLYYKNETGGCLKRGRRILPRYDKGTRGATAIVVDRRSA